MLLLIGSFHRQMFAKATNQPIVLQFQVSHTRNTDQTSLIFKNKTVEFVTNVSQISSQMPSSSKNNSIRLGHFHTPLNDRFELLKKKIQVYQRLLEKKGKGIDLSKAMKATGINDFDMDPHAPIIRLGMNGQSIEVRESNPYFKSLHRILLDAQKHKWDCLSCAEYKKDGKNIVRTFKKKGRQTASAVFSKSHLQCLYLNKRRIECLDQQFGLFELE